MGRGEEVYDEVYGEVYDEVYDEVELLTEDSDVRARESIMTLLVS